MNKKEEKEVAAGTYILVSKMTRHEIRQRDGSSCVFPVCALSFFLKEAKKKERRGREREGEREASMKI